MTQAIRKTTWDVTGDLSWKNFSALRTQMLLAGKRVLVQLVPEKRSLSQNALSHAIYTQIAGQLEDQTVAEVRAECKLRYGVGILREANERFRAMYDKAIKDTLSYEEKLDAMEFLPVTRLMDKEQFSEYLDTVIREYSKQGIAITMPGEEW